MSAIQIAIRVLIVGILYLLLCFSLELYFVGEITKLGKRASWETRWMWTKRLITTPVMLFLAFLGIIVFGTIITIIHSHASEEGFLTD